jgi:hypothetical protein
MPFDNVNPKASRTAYDNAWWLDAQSRQRSACAAMQEAHGVNLAEHAAECAAISKAWNAKRDDLAELRNSLSGDKRDAVQDEICALIESGPAFPVIHSHRTAPSIWVSRPAYTYTDHRGLDVRVKAARQVRVPALCYWPNQELPRGYTVLQSDGTKPAYSGLYETWLRERAALESVLQSKIDSGNLTRCEIYKIRRRFDRLEIELQRKAESLSPKIAETNPPAQPAKIEPAKPARAPRKPAAKKAAQPNPVPVIIAAPVPAAIAEPAAPAILALPAPIEPKTREENMNELRNLADVPGRSIPENSTEIFAPNGDVIYVYRKGYETRKGRKGFSLYAKAFRAGQRRHEWHHIFADEAALREKMKEFFGAVIVEAV